MPLHFSDYHFFGSISDCKCSARVAFFDALFVSHSWRVSAGLRGVIAGP